MGLESRFNNFSELKTGLRNFEECPSDTYRLKTISFCAFYNSDKCKKREECSYYQKMQAKTQEEKN